MMKVKWQTKFCQGMSNAYETQGQILVFYKCFTTHKQNEAEDKKKKKNRKNSKNTF